MSSCRACGREADQSHRFCIACGLPVFAPEDLDDTPVPGIDYALADVDADVDEHTMAFALPVTADAEPPARPATRAASGPVRPSASLRTRCGNCEAINSSQREFCARCDLSLDGSGGRATRPVVEMPRRSVFEGPERRSLTWVGVSLATVLGAGAVVLAVLATSQTGPFSPAGPAVFDPQVYAGDPVELRPRTLSARTEHEPIGDSTYEVSLLLDDDPTTAWNSDGDQLPDGIGEELQIELGQPAWVTGLVFANGYQRDATVYADNARPTLIRVTLDGVDFDVELLDRMGEQQVSFGTPRLTTSIRITVLDVAAGDRYRDLAISELDVIGHQAVGRDVALAESRRGTTS